MSDHPALRRAKVVGGVESASVRPSRPARRDDAPLLLTVEEAARSLRIGRSKLYQLLARGEVPVVRIGRSVRIPRRALQVWVERCTGKTLWLHDVAVRDGN